MPANCDKAEDLDASVQSGRTSATPADSFAAAIASLAKDSAAKHRVNYEKLAVWFALAVGPWLIAALAWYYFS